MRIVNSTLTQERAKELLNYDPLTGIFTWKHDKRCGQKHGRIHVYAGDVAGCMKENGYLCIRLDKRLYLSHRLAWLWMTGAWPVNFIDHKNGVRHDLRFDNLRDVTRAVNMQNLRTRKGGNLIGAYWREDRQKWTSQIKADGTLRYIGIFDTEQEAHEAYVKAKRLLHPGCTI